MAKGRSIHLGSKNFFTLVVLSVGALGVMLFTYASQTQTNTQSEATGGNYGSLSNCTLKNGSAGGIQLFNDINQQGGYRIMCMPIITGNADSKPNHWDHNLNKDSGGGAMSNIWNFNNKTDSMVLRVNPGCSIRADIYDGAVGSDGWLEFISVSNIFGKNAESTSRNLPLKIRDRADAIQFQINCNFNP